MCGLVIRQGAQLLGTNVEPQAPLVNFANVLTIVSTWPLPGTNQVFTWLTAWQKRQVSP